MNIKSNQTAAGRKQRLRLRVSPVAESHLRAGHPWLYADSIRDQNREGEAGELAAIFDRQDRFLAIGLFDPDSPIRLRVLHVGKPQTIDAGWWAARLNQAVDRRRGLFDEQTNGYRLINGESDGWPGMVIDRYDTTLVLKIYTPIWLPLLCDVIELARAHLSPERIVLRWSRNLESKLVSRLFPSQEAGRTKEHDRARIVFGTAISDPIVFKESGLNFEADVLRGQKTGFFLDQRENRRRIESLARGRNVLNAFSFSGGFSLYAARGEAASVLDLDISAHALESAKRNFARNQLHPGVARCRHESLQADTFDWLKESDRRFDLIILDPPSFAKREADRAGAIRAYERLAELGLGHLKPGGILLSCSCSAHVTAEEFFGAVRRAAGKSNLKLQELETTRHAPDHHATFKEAEYLKAVYLKAH